MLYPDRSRVNPRGPDPVSQNHDGDDWSPEATGSLRNGGSTGESPGQRRKKDLAGGFHRVRRLALRQEWYIGKVLTSFARIGLVASIVTIVALGLYYPLGYFYYKAGGVVSSIGIRVDAGKSQSRENGGEVRYSEIPRPLTQEEIQREIRRTGFLGNPSMHFDYSNAVPVTISDGAGGTLTAVAVGLQKKDPSEPALLTLFWHDQTFLGWDSSRTHPQKWTIQSEEPGSFTVSYYRFSKGLPFFKTIRYKWDGKQLVADGDPPDVGFELDVVRLPGT